jgi:hypothetical protein
MFAEKVWRLLLAGQEDDPMPRLLIGVALGAAGAFMLDPQQGARRRALVRDKAVHAVHEWREFLDVGWRNLRQRGRGALARAASSTGASDAVDDEILAERVRSKLGRCVSHPGALSVSAERGRVRLSGDVLAEEHPGLLKAVASVPGVREVEDAVARHARADGVSSLQGKGRAGEAAPALTDQWTPAARLAAGGAGGALLFYACRAHGLSGGAALIAGTGMLLRAGANRRLLRAQRAGGTARAARPSRARGSAAASAPPSA